jgi:hypothetical protein
MMESPGVLKRQNAMMWPAKENYSPTHEAPKWRPPRNQIIWDPYDDRLKELVYDQVCLMIL